QKCLHCPKVDRRMRNSEVKLDCDVEGCQICHADVIGKPPGSARGTTVMIRSRCQTCEDNKHMFYFPRNEQYAYLFTIPEASTVKTPEKEEKVPPATTIDS
ncbi:hypothetical protein PTTG_25805, partial [Puccinia triticina 1-1 BBBD Race 1]